MDLSDYQAASARRVFLVVNKQDLTAPEERRAVLDHIREQARIVLGNGAFQLFSVSARLAIEANREDNQVKRTDSGMPILEEALVEFLLQEKQQEFLVNMADRVASLFAPHPGCRSLMREAGDLQKRFASWRTYDTSIPSPEPQSGSSPRFVSCEVCARIERTTFDFLRHYQYELCYIPEAREDLVRGKGPCRYHARLYETMASPRGTCIGLAEALEYRAARLRQAARGDENDLPSAVAALEITVDRCVLCAAHREAGCQAVEDLVHLLTEADMLDRLVEDMRRYVLNCDAARRYLITEEENAAQIRALMIMAGHRNVDGARKRRSE